MASNLENVERFKLNIFALVSQHVHHHLKVRLLCNVPCHDVEVGAIEENLAKKLKRLSFGYIVVG